MGTAYFSSKKTATIADKAAFRRFVIGGELFDLLDWKANAIAVENFVKENKELPAGVNFTVEQTLRVNAPGAKPEENEDTTHG
jgi:hypothetical protein